MAFLMVRASSIVLWLLRSVTVNGYGYSCEPLLPIDYVWTLGAPF